MNASMTYEKLARSFRHYYKKGILDSGETVISPVSKCGKRKLYYKFSAATLKRFLGIESGWDRSPWELFQSYKYFIMFKYKIILFIWYEEVYKDSVIFLSILFFSSGNTSIFDHNSILVCFQCNVKVAFKKLCTVFVLVSL